MYTKTEYKDLQAHILFTADTFVPHTQTHQPFEIKAVQLSPHPCSPSTLHLCSFVYLSNDEPVCEGRQQCRSATADLPLASPPCFCGCVRMTALSLVPPSTVGAILSQAAALLQLHNCPRCSKHVGTISSWCSALLTQQEQEAGHEIIMTFNSFKVEVNR